MEQNAKLKFRKKSEVGNVPAIKRKTAAAEHLMKSVKKVSESKKMPRDHCFNRWGKT